MTIAPDAYMFDYQTGVKTKLVPMSDGQDTYAPAVVSFGPLAPAEYDYIDLAYTGANLTTVLYKINGASGTTVATLTLAYDGSNNLISVTRS